MQGYIASQFAYTVSVGLNLWATCQITAVDINHCCASTAKRIGEIISLLVLRVTSRKVEIAHPIREGDGRRQLILMSGGCSELYTSKHVFHLIPRCHWMPGTQCALELHNNTPQLINDLFFEALLLHS